MSDKTFYIETYGCQMNFADTEVVNSILMEEGMTPVHSAEEADIIFVNTCSIRENAETRVWNRLKEFRSIKKEKQHLTVGVMGCMAERVKDKIIDQEQLVDIVVGPDAYRDIPNLLAEVNDGRKAVNVLLSLEETYADITPVRTSDNGLSAFVSIMRGCDNMCAFCVVPFTRGRERSRPMESILNELKQLSESGYKEVTLLGQNVNSYKTESADFTKLMHEASHVNPEMRIRFSSPHPKDFPKDLLYLIQERPNLCSSIHIPAQSGNNSVLERMRRPYTREQYLELINDMRNIIPGVTLSTDMITGFCGETEEEHSDTMSLMKTVRYDLAYMFAYSERPGTMAERKLEDDVPEKVKKRRLQDIIALQQRHSLYRTQQHLGKVEEVLIEKESKKSDQHWAGRNTQNTMVVFPKENYQIGDFVMVKIKDCTSATLLGEAVKKSPLGI